MAKPLHIILADDDADDRLFFNMELNVVSPNAKLTMLEDGEKLLKFLSLQRKLPDVLFLDLNMPKIHGEECLAEIKKNEKLKHLPVVIHSTACHDIVADKLYKLGAHHFNRKTDSTELHHLLNHVLQLVASKKFERPDRSGFILSFNKNHILS